MSKSAKSRIVLITGVTKGLGEAMAAKFASLGHRVIGCGRQVTVIESMRARYVAPHRFDVVDVSRDADVARWAKSVLAEVGPPDLVLNNAAIINRNAVLWDVPAEEFDAVIDVNIKGVTNVIRHFVPAMIERGSGVIVNFSSGWGRSTSAEVAPYCATKWAIEGLTQAMAQEIPDGMAAIPLNPGIINTDMLQSAFGSSAGRYPDPVRWAEATVPFLLQLSAKDNGEPLSAPI
ncbi:MAG: SDR family NAD(P)-dependent oxidoreductase [Planctomycetaceae bacterium]|nr:SDR family NAD(P)-dependent oxidoreductase [Planctomycetaceae bacterium]